MNQEILELTSHIESLDDALELWSVLKAKERDMNWLQGDFLAAMIGRFGDSKETYGKFAEIGWGKIAHLRQVEKVARAYPDEEERLPDVKWSYFRACYNASTRTGENPFAVLTKALELNWAMRDVERYGKPTDEVEFILVEQCPVCKTQYAMRRTDLIIDTIDCPVCALDGVKTPLGNFVRKE